jgi:hypothetical protein
MSQQKLYFTIIGCTPKGRHVEQHDVYIGIADKIPHIIPQLKAFWPEAADNMHLDAFRTITIVDGHSVSIVSSTELIKNEKALFFINLGGYKPNEPEEFHYKMLVVAKDKGEAIQKAKETTFYKHTGFDKALSHVDDKYGVDVDDVYQIEDMLSAELKSKYKIKITVSTEVIEDKLHLGYFKLSKLEKGDIEPS